MGCKSGEARRIVADELEESGLTGSPSLHAQARIPQCSKRTVVYLHGGAWVNEIAPQHWQLAAQIAADPPVRVIVPSYPLVPFATAADVVLRIAELVAEEMAPDHSVCLAGDSAGGQMALSTALITGVRSKNR